ncbi:MAG TPA: VWA domain-containing protein [Nitrosopumilaceae archaeon]|nr:VWA domain-containing protein [Nitrosopumilaceae archaeon]
MFRHDTKNLVYFLNKKEQKKSESKEKLSENKIQQILETLAKQAMKEKHPTLEELESILQNSNKPKEEQETETKKQEIEQEEGSASITKLLKEQGYLRENKKWLTNKGFFEIGAKILHEVMKDLTSDDFGLHETNYSGDGNVIIDTTKKFEPGDDIKFLSTPHTLLNSIQRISKTGTKIDFPISIEPDDFEKFETLEDVNVAVVYCIDLSSTMKYSLGKNGKSRIEAAKKALWSLYVLNKKFFPNDSIFVVGFASMASMVNPIDIPFLKTYDANDNFLHYTNYQAALSLARKILLKNAAQNKRIVMITDGQPSACFIENEKQKNDIISEKPYSNFYSPDKALLEKIKNERNMNLDSTSDRLVYLCYRYKKVDPKINKRTLLEAKQCIRNGIKIDTIVVSEEIELLNYVQELEKELKGKTYHINQENMDKVLVHDYLSNTRKVLNSKQNW